MSVDVRESFPGLEDATGAGVALTKSLEGDAAAGKVAQVAFAFKDASGNVILPTLDTQGRIPVSSEGQGTRLRGRGVVPGTVLSATGASYSGFAAVASVAATISKTYGDFSGRVACRRGALFQLAYKDNASVVVLDEAICDSGQYTSPVGFGPGVDTFTVPASAVSPQFVIQAGNFQNPVSDLHGGFAVVQF